ncbi:response regulator [Acetohalobium arabaticum]|uniref:Stage 0 sporulation protein A homolog n=1 Tax=Acetohalobium arabaticum (strain ATCC 49924 / DSM 5501 / Z-7288) TaxID=574087 RepID=D9QQU4_ACEAZ|nr:response regulator [Acetohalobium arabaticum]ADL12885.1 response regulator receiver protein [Acetohalobium arabaticum DSM 5501]
MTQEKILIVDDEKNIRKTLKQCLQTDYEVVTAVNGEDGIDKFAEDDFAVILLDMKLPGIDGIKVLEEIKKEDNGANVIMITGFGSVKTAVKTMKLGAVDYLRKPFTPDEIRKIVQEVIDRDRIEIVEEELDSYEDYVQYAKSCINDRKFEKAREYLQKAVSLDTSKPEAFNLLGVIFEMQDKLKEAQKEYRAALALDPSYKPARDNLDRTTQFEYQKRDINLGEVDEEEDETEEA